MNELAVSIAIILFPGLITAVIADKITLHSPKWGSFKYGMYSFVFGVLSYALLGVLMWIVAFCPWLAEKIPSLMGGLDIWKLVTAAKVTIDPKEIVAATLLSPVVAFLSAYLINFKVFNKIAEFFRISRKFGDENLFSFYLNSNNIDWIYVRDPERNLTYEGRVFSFSENDQMQELVMFDVKVYSYDESTELYSLPTIYISRPIGSFLIEAIPETQWENTNGTETT